MTPSFKSCLLLALSVGVCLARPSFKALAANSPADDGLNLPIPLSAPALPPGMDAFNPPRLGIATAPAIAEFTRSAGPDDIVTIAGPDFSGSTQFRFYGQTTARNGMTAERKVITASSNAASVILPKQLPPWSTYLMWPKNGTTYGKPVILNRTDAWWIGSDAALSGETVAVYGRNLAHDNGTTVSWIYLKPLELAKGQWVKPISVNPYRVEFRVPALSPGSYEVWAHNGHGGRLGWSGPLALTVLAQSPWAGQSAHVFNVRDYGAVGDGVADETAAIQSALNAAAKAAPATVYFPAGNYMVNGMIEMKDNVSWLGDNRDTTFIKAGPDFAGKTPTWWQALIYSDADAINYVEFRNLTLDGNDNLGKKSLIVFRHHKYVKLTNSRFIWKGAANGFNIGSDDYLTIAGNEFVGDQVFLADGKQVVVQDNKFRLTDYANAAVISWGGSEVAVSHNQAEDYDPAGATLEGVGSGRFFVSQCHPDSNRYFYIGDNTTVNMSPPVNIGDSNQGEQIMFEVGTSTLVASPMSVTPTTVTFATSPPIVTSQEAIIIKGRGVGQVRHVTAINGNTITVSPAWSVVPDATSTIGVGPAQTYSVIYHNTLDGKSSNATYQTASVAMTMYGNVSDVVFADNRVTDMRAGLVDEYSQVPDPRTPTPSLACFNLVTGNSLDRSYQGMRIVTNFMTKDALGTVGHLGNTYRWNTLSNIVSQGVHLGAEQGGFRGGDLDQDVFEHNTITNVPTALRVGKATTWFNNPVNTIFNNFVLYSNTFDRGTAALPGSKALDISGNTTSLWRSANKWTGFEANTQDG